MTWEPRLKKVLGVVEVLLLGEKPFISPRGKNRFNPHLIHKALCPFHRIRQARSECDKDSFIERTKASNNKTWVYYAFSLFPPSPR